MSASPSSARNLNAGWSFSRLSLILTAEVRRRDPSDQILAWFTMAAVSDAYGDPKFGFGLATTFALLLCARLAVNWWGDRAQRRLRSMDRVEHESAAIDPRP